MPSLSLLVLKTNQLDVLREFYARLGFVFQQEQHGRGPIHFSAPLGAGVLEIYPLPDGVVPDATTRLGFAVDDLPAALTELEEPPTAKKTAWGWRAVVRDPDGRAVELYQKRFA